MYSDDDFDDFDEVNNLTSVDEPSTSKSSSTGKCANCGSTQFYRDERTDNLICSNCFTMMQSQSQRGEVDEDDAMRFGSMSVNHSLQNINKRRNRRSIRKTPDWDLDKSMALPNVVYFCDAFQILLKAASAKIGEIVSPVKAITSLSSSKSGGDNNNNDDEEEQQERRNEQERHQLEKEQEKFQKILLHRVQRIWFQYLEAWNKAAIHYSNLYPECRLSFRDLFLPQRIRCKILNFISAKTLKDVKQFIAEKTEDGIMDSDGNGGGEEGVINEKLKKVIMETEGKLSKSALYSYKDDQETGNQQQYRGNEMNKVKFEISDESDGDNNNKRRQGVIKWEDQEKKKDDDTSSDDDNIERDNNQGSQSSSSQRQSILRKKRKRNWKQEKIDDGDDHNCSDIYDKGNKKFRRPVASISSILSKGAEARIGNGSFNPHYAAFKLNPSLNLLSSIIYLALLQCNVGVSSHHIISWAYSGLYPYLLNGLKHLPKSIQSQLKKCSCTYAFEQKLLPKPALLDYYSDLLIITIGLDKGRDDTVPFLMERKDRHGPDTLYTRRQMRNFSRFNRKNSLRKHLAPKKPKRKHRKRDTSGDVIKIDESTLSSSRNSSSQEEKLQNDDSTDLLLGQLTPESKDPSIKQYYQENIPLMAYRFVSDLGL